MYVMEMNLEDIIAEKDEKNQRLLMAEFRNLGGYETLGEFFEDLEEMSEKNDPKAIRLYRFAEWLSHESLFYSLVNLLEDLKSSVHTEYAIKAITKIPNEPKALCEAVSKVLDSVQRFQEPGVLYQAVALLHRMEMVDSSVRACLRTRRRITLDENVLREVSNRMENLAKYEEDFHKNSDVRADFASKDKFIEFANEFINFKNTL